MGASRSTRPSRRGQHCVFVGVPMTRRSKSFNKLAHTPSFRVSIGQVCAFGADGDGGVGAFGAGVDGEFGAFGVRVDGGFGAFGDCGNGGFGAFGVGVDGEFGDGGDGAFGAGCAGALGDLCGGGGQGVVLGWVELTKVKKTRFIVRRRAMHATDLEPIFVYQNRVGRKKEKVVVN
ncbi:hypothetical protein M5689_004968 [Euphorbia peplus]|nr:hypothetical protein M5689_004968 [Euphorbia peplus]